MKSKCCRKPLELLHGVTYRCTGCLAGFTLTTRPTSPRFPPMTIPVWTDAACKLLPPDTTDRLFFPGSMHPQENARRSAAAKRICNACPILSDCREWALAHPDLASHGTWGGLTGTERYELTRRRRAA